MAQSQSNRGIREADAASFENLYADHHRAVLAYCARRASRADAWDATAEVFAITWRRRADVPNGDGALPWLYAVAMRVLSNQRRSAHRRRELYKRAAHAATPEPSSPDLQLVRHEEEREVIEALSRLRGPDREIIQLALWEELDRADISVVLGVSRNAVDQRLSRAKRRLAKELEHHTRVAGNATRTATKEGGAA